MILSYTYVMTIHPTMKVPQLQKIIIKTPAVLQSTFNTVFRSKKYLTVSSSSSSSSRIKKIYHTSGYGTKSNTIKQIQNNRNVYNFPFLISSSLMHRFVNIQRNPIRYLVSHIKEGDEHISTKLNHTYDNDDVKIIEEEQIGEKRQRREQWEIMLQELVDYSKEHGNCLVPAEYDLNPRLGNWVDTQRQQYRYFNEGQKSHLNSKRIQALESIGFVWNLPDLKWEEHFQNLLLFKQRYGHCNVSKQHTKEYESLYTWVFMQRRHYKQKNNGMYSTLTDERIQALQSIGFVWNMQEEMWLLRFNQLKEYKANHGDCLVPKFYPQNPQLAKWVEQQRTQYRYHLNNLRSNMTQERIELLEDLDFIWDVYELRWESRYQQLLELYKLNGHSNVQLIFKKNKQRQFSNHPLVNWCKNQKKEYQNMIQGNKTQMTQTRLQKLRKVAFEF